MRFMMMIKANVQEFEEGAPPPPALEEAIGNHIEKMMKLGVLVTTGGLAPPSQGSTIRVGGGTATVIDGPFTEAKEVVGGFAILQVSSREEAIARGREFMQLHIDALGPSYTGELEVRQIFGPDAD